MINKHPKVTVPNLFIPGFAKSGTSSLHNILASHPNIKEGIGKEFHAYLNDKKYKRRFKKKNQYSFHHFYNKVKSEELYFIDSSTGYSVYPESIKRILKDTPDAKFIIIARDPFDRIRSHYRWMVSLGFVEKEFEDEIRSEAKNKFITSVNYWGNRKNYVYFSRYGLHLSRFIKLVPKSQFIFIKYEEFIENTQEVVDRLCDFLSIDRIPAALPESNKTKAVVSPKFRSLKLRLRYNTGRWFNRNFKGYQLSEPIKNPLKEVPSIDDDQLHFLAEYLEDDIKQFISLGYDLKFWSNTKRILRIN